VNFFPRLLLLSFAFATSAFAAPPRLVFLTVGGEFDPTPELRVAAAPWSGRLTVEVIPSGAAPTDLKADLVVVDAAGDLSAAATAALDAARAAGVRVLPVRAKPPAISDATLDAYFAVPSTENFRRLVSHLAVRELRLAPPPGLAVATAAITPIDYPLQAIYHPDAPAPGFFRDLPAYEAWLATRAKPAAPPTSLNSQLTTLNSAPHAPPTVGISFHRSFFLRETQQPIDALIRAIEARGARALAWMSQGAPDYAQLLRADGPPVIDVLLFIGERLSLARKGDGLDQLRALGVPVLSTFQHFSQTPAEFVRSPGGLAPVFTGPLADHERDGLIEPLLIAGKGTATGPGRTPAAVIPAQIEWRIDRALAWAKLRRAPNSAKNLVFTYWSEGAGKANVGGDPDDFLDVPGSLAALLTALKARGYDVGPGPLPTRDQLSDRMAREASNIGTWAPGELAARVRSGALALLPAETYIAWFDALPANRREEIVAAWGPPPGRVMVHTDESGKKFIVFPRLQFGRVMIAAHPDWGYLQDDTVLVSKDALPPHHQYLAFFLWQQREVRTDAWISLFSNIVLQPGKSEGPAADDHIGLMLGAIPHIHPEKMGGNGALSNKRKGLAVTPGWANHVVPSDALAPLAELAARIRRTAAVTDATQRADAETAIRDEVVKLDLARELDLDPRTAPASILVERVRAHLAKLERASMPHGSHVIGEPPSDRTLADMVALMVKPELRPRLPADLAESDYRRLVASVIFPSTELSAALQPLRTQLSALQSDIIRHAENLRAAPRELAAILDILEGRWIEPGPFDEPLRNPDSVPGGRNLYGLDPRIIPTPEAEISGRRQADELIAAHRAKHDGAYPQKLAYVLWSSGITKTGGAPEAAVLYLLGTRPVRDERGRVTGVELIPRAELGRPRIDVLMTTSGTYRDHFQDKVDLITSAVRLAATSPEADNPVRSAVAARTKELTAAGETDARATQLATARVFSPAPGAYSPGTQFLAKSGDARGDDNALSELYLRRLGHAYGGGLYGDFQRPLFEKNLGNVDAATLPRSGFVNAGVLDNPMPAAFLGGLGQAVRRVSGRDPGLYTTDLRQGDTPKVETVAATIAAELRTRYFNPKFIEALKARGYDGARYPMFLAEHLDLWDTTSPDTVQSSDWGKLKKVYVDDEFGLGLADFFQKHNPFAKQMIMANLLQASERGHWQASAADLADLAQKLAESAQNNGLVCEANVCRNARLTALVEKSLAGVPAAAELMQAYRGALEKIQSVAAALAEAPAAPAPDAAPAAATPVAAAASAAPAAAPSASPMVEGKVLEDKYPKPDPAAAATASAATLPWLWLGLGTAALALFGFGLSRRAP
jgi:cobaltochelatase CobN